MAAQKLSQTVIANKILDRLNEYDNRYKYFYAEALMLPIFEDMGLLNTQTNRTKSRRILERLFSAGHVVRTGSSNKHQYQISTSAKTNGWDKEYPFNSLDGREAPIPDIDDETDDETESKERDEEATARKMVDKMARDDEPVDVRSTVAINAETAEQIRSLKHRVKELETNEKLIREELEAKETRLDKIEQLASSASAFVRTLKVEKYDGKIITLKNVILPSYFEMMLDLAKQRRNILLVGPAGCGKTTVAGLLAKTLGMKFGKIGGCGGLTESHLLGTKTPNLTKGRSMYQASEFVIRYENGGVMLIDELDGTDQNVLLVLNPALDRSGELPLMNRLDNPLAKRHKDFICIATANTFGQGNNRIYAGRNQLDASTLSRFQIGMIEVDYDMNVERAICPDSNLLDRIHTIRRKANEAVLRRVIDTRFVEDAWVMKSVAGWSDDKVIGQLLQGWTRDERNRVGMAA